MARVSVAMRCAVQITVALSHVGICVVLFGIAQRLAISGDLLRRTFPTVHFGRASCAEVNGRVPSSCSAVDFTL